MMDGESGKQEKQGVHSDGDGIFSGKRRKGSGLVGFGQGIFGFKSRRRIACRSAEIAGKTEQKQCRKDQVYPT